jgi:hypothetical protein
MTVLQRARVTLGILLTNIVAVLFLAKHMLTCLTLNAAKFPALPVPLATFATQVADLQAAQDATGDKAKGKAATRTSKLGPVVTTMKAYCGYVQLLIAPMLYADGAALAALAGLALAKAATHAKAFLKGYSGPHPGSVRLKANAKLLTAGLRGKITFHWRFSADQGKNWQSVPSTPVPQTIIENVAPLVEYWFQVSASNKSQTTAWSESAKFVLT